MLNIYDIGMRIGRRAILTLSGVARNGSQSKLLRFAHGQEGALGEMEEMADTLDRRKPTIWIHAASLGEFGIARPIIRRLKNSTECNVVLTFFSPTGYEALKSRHDDNIDAVLYLPFDTVDNVKRFLDTIHPDCAVFMVSEYWHNYLHELNVREIPCYLVSAVIRRDSPFFKWYGNLYRKSIGYFNGIYVLNQESKDLLETLKVENVTVNGDPLFDNVALIAATSWEDKIVERFVNGQKIFIAGSVHDDEDLQMIIDLANRHQDTRFIIVPHEITPSILHHIKDGLQGSVKFYTRCNEMTDFNDVKTLVIDFVGALAYIYRYATWAYVGGGFTKFLHSIIEPAVYGIPVSFGPNINRKVVTRQMLDLGIGQVVKNSDELDRWFCSLKNGPERLREIASKASTYVNQNVGASQRVVNKIMEDICEKK